MRLPAGAEPGETPAALVQALLQALAGPDGPADHHRATQVSCDGPTDVVTVAHCENKSMVLNEVPAGGELS